MKLQRLEYQKGQNLTKDVADTSNYLCPTPTLTCDQYEIWDEKCINVGFRVWENADLIGLSFQSLPQAAGSKAVHNCGCSKQFAV